MKFLSSLFAFAVTAIMVSAQAPIDTASIVGPFVDALKKANLSVVAGLASQHADALVPYLRSPANKTLLVPTDTAITKILATLKTLPAKSIESILLYHVVNGTISYATTPQVFDYHIVAPTYLNDTNYIHLPHGKKQVLVFQRPDSDDPIKINYGANDTAFTSRIDGPLLGNIQIQVIDDVLIPPGTFTNLVSSDESDLSAIGAAFNQSKLIPNVEAAKGVTIFAPTTAALKAVSGQVRQSLTDRDMMMTLLNHVINGTVVYSSQFPQSEAQNGPVSIKTTTLRTAAGMTLSFQYQKDGSIQVYNSNYTAKIVKSDVIISNGVVHYIDGVVLNASFNLTNAQNTTDQITSTQALPSVQSQSVQAAASTHPKDNSDSAMGLSTSFLVAMPLTLALGAFLTLV